MTKPSYLLIYVFLVIFLFIFFSFRLADTPDGINADEASYGYNGILLAQDLRDQNGRFLPLFILASDGVTWYPPYMQYLVALFFKVFGPSVFIMRFTTVVLTVVSALLMLYFARLLFDKKDALVAFLSFLIIPEVMIETHSPLEHIIVIPFTLVWLIGLLKYRQTFKLKYLALAGFSLGSGLYSYAGIRPFVAIWILVSGVYMIYLNWPKKISLKSLLNRKLVLPLLLFGLSALPFFVIIPFLESRYPGAVLNRVSFKVESVYSFFYYYLASFDPSFLFVSGDKLLIQSTGKHGMFLLATLPVLAIGIYQAFAQRFDFWKFLAITFFISPLLFGFVGSAFFAHRLMYMIPFYCLFFVLGIQVMFRKTKILLRWGSFLLVLLVAINFFDFWRYYMYSYPKDTYHIFHHLEDYNKPYQALAQHAKESGLDPFISQRVARLDRINIDDIELFSRAIYFPKLPPVLEEQTQLPENGILLSTENNLTTLKKLDIDARPYFLYVNPEK